MTKKKSDPKTLRLPLDLMERIEKIRLKSGLTDAAIIQLCVRAGLPELESGRVNLFSTGTYHVQEITSLRAAEAPKKSNRS